jgi:hypothetical protein
LYKENVIAINKQLQGLNKLPTPYSKKALQTAKQILGISLVTSVINPAISPAKIISSFRLVALALDFSISLVDNQIPFF